MFPCLCLDYSVIEDRLMSKRGFVQLIDVLAKVVCIHRYTVLSVSTTGKTSCSSDID